MYVMRQTNPSSGPSPIVFEHRESPTGCNYGTRELFAIIACNYPMAPSISISVVWRCLSGPCYLADAVCLFWITSALLFSAVAYDHKQSD